VTEGVDKLPRRLTFLVLDAPLRPSIVVVARDPLVRSGLRAVLEAYPGLVLKEALGSAEPGLLADAVVWDAPEAAPPTLIPTLVLVNAAEEARSALQAGALGALARSSPASAIAPAALAVASGHWVLDAAFAPALLDLRAAPAAPVAPTPPLLSPREAQVLELLAEGLSNRDIAERLGISRHTAKFHVNAILDKLGATTRTEAVVLAARGGLLTL
jgi:two-component system, NarL family, nitrate/nitrite response regulator NarL